MRTLLFLLCGAVCFAAPVPSKTSPAKPSVPSEGAIRTAVQSAVVSWVGKYQIGGQVIGATATVKEIRPMTGWEGKYSVTGTVQITTRSANGNGKQIRSFSCTAETEGNSVKVSDISV